MSVCVQRSCSVWDVSTHPLVRACVCVWAAGSQEPPPPLTPPLPVVRVSLPLSSLGADVTSGGRLLSPSLTPFTSSGETFLEFSGSETEQRLQSSAAGRTRQSGTLWRYRKTENRSHSRNFSWPRKFLGLFFFVTCPYLFQTFNSLKSAFRFCG